MNTQAINLLFEQAFSGGTLAALAPLIALAVGLLTCLVTDMVPALKWLRPLCFVGSLLTAGALALGQVGGDAQVILDGTFRADTGTALWTLVFMAATLLSWLYSIGYYGGNNAHFKADHDALFLTATMGMVIMVGAQDLLVFFLGLELLSVPLYTLAAFRRARTQSVEAGLKYFLLGAFAVGLFLYGVALVYSEAGTVSLPELRLRGGLHTVMGIAGAGLITAGLFFKVSVFPFHLWVPDVYEGSPTPVTALMATGTKAAAFGFLIQVAFLLPAEAAGSVALLAVLTMAAGNLGALAQTNVKRMLAYSGIAHAGTLLLIVAAQLSGGITAHAALTATLFYMGAYVFTAAGAFGILALLEADGQDTSRLENLRGLSHSRPGLAAAMTLFMLSLGGIPATGGFLGKYLVFGALVEAGMIKAAVFGVLLSVVALGYYLRVIVAMYMQAAPEGRPAPTVSRPLTAGLATLICAAGVVAMGVAPHWFWDALG